MDATNVTSSLISDVPQSKWKMVHPCSGHHENFHGPEWGSKWGGFCASAQLTECAALHEINEG